MHAWMSFIVNVLLSLASQWIILIYTRKLNTVLGNIDCVLLGIGCLTVCGPELGCTSAVYVATLLVPHRPDLVPRGH